MINPLVFAPSFRHVLLVAAAPKELEAVVEGFGHTGIPDEWRRMDIADGWSVLRSGVGKVNGAVCVSQCLAAGGEPGTLVINVGVCGALPREAAEGGMLPVGSVIVGSASVYADEGVDAGAAGYTDMAALGLGYWPGALATGSGCSMITADPEITHGLAHQLWAGGGVRVQLGKIATVSTCSGTDARAQEIARRTGAVAEAMEGAAIGHALTRLRVGAHGFIELRVVSNKTGERATQAWDLPGALAMLTRVVTTLRSGQEQAKA